MIKRLSKCVRQYRSSSVLSALFVAAEVVMEVIIPLFMAQLIDRGIGTDAAPGSMSEILRYGGILAVCCVISLAFGALSGGFCAYASAGFASNLRRDMYFNVQNFAFSNIDKFSTSSIVTRLTTDVNNVQMAFMMIIRIAVRSPAMLVFSLIMAFRLNASLALIFLAAVPILGIGLYFIVKKAHPIFEKVFKTYDKLNRVVQENLMGIRVVKTFVRENEEKKKFGDVSESIYDNFTKAERTVALNMPLMQFCMYGCMILISWFGARLIVTTNGQSDAFTTGQLMSLITYSMQILMSLMMLSMVFVMITISRASAERIVEVLDEKPDIVSPADAVKTVRDGAVSFRNVSFSYGGKGSNPCLKNIDLDIKSGETVGIIGGTGSSKSTLIQLISRLYDVTDGTLTVGGVDVCKYDLETLRDAVAVVLQKNVLFSGTIKENLRWGNADATDDEMNEACCVAQAEEFIKTFPDGYDTYIEQGGVNVSGGQKQRLCIARALLKNPKILILDDSTSAVDTATEEKIRAGLADDLPETTKIIIAQRISSVENADKIIVMDNGMINGIGTHDELMKSNEIYREVWMSQVKGGGEDE